MDTGGSALMSLSDQEFERALLASAKADDPPAQASADMTARAWAQFSARAAAVGEAARGDAPSSGGTSGPAPRRLTGGVRWRWLLAGALGGSAVTAALFVRRPPAHVASVMVRAAETSPPDTKPPPAVPAPLTPPGRANERPAVRHDRRRTTAPIDRPSVDPAPPSTLAAEVAALDAARAAAASRQFDEALRLIGRYHYDFPAGELAADAEVIAIEALDAKNDRAEATRRGSRFVQQHPDDPHAARIKRLLLQ
jgi:TolA-binding protein